MPAGSSSTNEARSAPSPEQKDPDTLALEKLLTDTIGMIVSVEHKGKGGVLRIAYRSLEQLDELCRRLKQD